MWSVGVGRGVVSGVERKGEQELCDVQPSYSHSKDKLFHDSRPPKRGW